MALPKQLSEVLGSEPKIIVDDTMNVSYIDWNLLVPYQGNLKQRSKTNELKMLKSMVSKGFFDVKKVWKDPTSNIIYILDGHQTVGTLEAYSYYLDKGMIEMIKSSNSQPTNEIPCVFINAKDRADLAEKLLIINSHFGEITEIGLASFIQDNGISNLFLRELPENESWNLGTDVWQSDTTEWVLAAIEAANILESNDIEIVEEVEKPTAKELPPKEESEKTEKEYTQSETREIAFSLSEENHKYVLSLLNRVKTNQMYESNADALIYIFQQAEMYAINIP